MRNTLRHGYNIGMLNSLSEYVSASDSHHVRNTLSHGYNTGMLNSLRSSSLYFYTLKMNISFCIFVQGYVRVEILKSKERERVCVCVFARERERE